IIMPKVSRFLLAMAVIGRAAVAITKLDVHYSSSEPGPHACSCSAGFVPVPIDVWIPSDPTNPAGLNTSDNRRLHTTFDIFGKLCQPLLLHGQSYSSQYWDIEWNGFQNYSYAAASCSRGLSSFLYDNTGAGRSTRPENATDCQMPTASGVLSAVTRDLKSGRISRLLTGRSVAYERVVGIGHSLGSVVMNFAAIREGEASLFDALVLTGHLHDPHFLLGSPIATVPASEAVPGRFAGLDPGYITTPNISARALFYGPSPTAYSPAVLQLDELTKDAGSRFISIQDRFVYAPAYGFSAPVVGIIGQFDQVHCIPNGGPCNQSELEASEAAFYPDARSFQMIVVEGSGHDINLEFPAGEVFQTMISLFERFASQEPKKF
ncbi:hypothetical protein BU17DRAFT_48874, partial [Hysterangium stoloniferum]